MAKSQIKQSFIESMAKSSQILAKFNGYNEFGYSKFMDISN